MLVVRSAVSACAMFDVVETWLDPRTDPGDGVDSVAPDPAVS